MCARPRADAAGSSGRRTYIRRLFTGLPKQIDQSGHVSEELGGGSRDDEAGTGLEALHAQTLQMLVDRRLEQVDEPLVRVEGAVPLEVLRVVPTEGFATAGGGARPHHTARQIRVGEQQLEFFDLD